MAIIRSDISIKDKTEYGIKDFFLIFVLICVSSGATYIGVINSMEKIVKQQFYDSKEICDVECINGGTFEYTISYSSKYFLDSLSTRDNIPPGVVSTDVIKTLLIYPVTSVSSDTVPSLNIASIEVPIPMELPSNCFKNLNVVLYQTHIKFQVVNSDTLVHKECGYFIDDLNQTSISYIFSISGTPFTTFFSLGSDNFAIIKKINIARVLSINSVANVNMQIIDNSIKTIDTKTLQFMNTIGSATLQNITVSITGQGVENYDITVKRRFNHYVYSRTTTSNSPLISKIQFLITALSSAWTIFTIIRSLFGRSLEYSGNSLSEINLTNLK
jgi:hypothetical protein